MIKCSICHKEKSESEFTKSQLKVKRCKLCRNYLAKEYRKLHPEKFKIYEKKRNKHPNRYYKIKARQYKKKYNISLEDFEELKIKQNNQCAICKQTPKVLCVDHCHKTGKVRGLLCHTCNRALGLLKDSSQVLTNALIYLTIKDE